MTATSADTRRLVASIAAELSEDVHTLQTGYLHRPTGRTPVLGIDRGGLKRAWLWIGDIAFARELNADAFRQHLHVALQRRDRILEWAKELHAHNPHGAWPVRVDDQAPMVLGPAGIEQASGCYWPPGINAVYATLQRTMPTCDTVCFSHTTIQGKSSSSQIRSFLHATSAGESERLAVLLPNFNGILRAYIGIGSSELRNEDRLTAEAWARSLDISGADLVDAGMAVHTIVSFTDINEIRRR